MTAIKYPIGTSLGSNSIKAFPRTQYDKIVEIIDAINGLATTATLGATTTTTLTASGLVTASAGVSMGTANATMFTVLTTLTATEIVGTAAGDIGHASGATLVTNASSAYTLEFVSAVAVYDFATAAYTGGANDLVVAIGSGGAAISGVCSTANLLGAAGDKIVYFLPLATAAVPMSVGTGISLRGTAYTQPGTAAGVVRVYTTYRVITTGL
jgi:hypothetical protein